jgi:hypothetical protein
MAEVLDRPAMLQGISTVAGRYIIGDSAIHPGINLFACRLRWLSVEEYCVAAPVIPPVGEFISAMFGPFGHLRGRLTRHTTEGFVVALDHDTGGRASLAKRIETFRERPWTGVRDRRTDNRFMPAEPRSVIQRPDGWAQPCLIVDYSSSGAALSAAYQPEVGEVVTVGQLTAVVVRQFETGFAIRFFERHNPEDIEGLLEAPNEWRDAVRASNPSHASPDNGILETDAADG